MDMQAAEDLVISELGNHRTHDEVARMLCEDGTFYWNQALQFIADVEQKHKGKIGFRKMPLPIFMAITTVIGSVVTAVFLLGGVTFTGKSVTVTPSGTLNSSGWSVARSLPGLAAGGDWEYEASGTYTGRDQLEFWANAGQTIVIDYCAYVQRGRLNLYIDEARGLIKEDYYNASIKSSGTNKIKITFPSTGYYRIRTVLNSFGGKLDLAWKFEG